MSNKTVSRIKGSKFEGSALYLTRNCHKHSANLNNTKISNNITNHIYSYVPDRQCIIFVFTGCYKVQDSLLKINSF